MGFRVLRHSVLEGRVWGHAVQGLGSFRVFKPGWYGSHQAFEEFVRGPLRQDLLLSEAGGVAETNLKGLEYRPPEVCRKVQPRNSRCYLGLFRSSKIVVCGVRRDSTPTKKI